MQVAVFNDDLDSAINQFKRKVSNDGILKAVKMQIEVRDGDIDNAIRQLKKKVGLDGILRAVKRRQAFEKPSATRRRKRHEALRRLKQRERKYAA